MKRFITNIELKVRLRGSIDRIWELCLCAILAAILIILLPVAGLAQGQYNIDGGYIVDFVDYEHDLADCKTTFFYEVQNNNTDPEISHFGFGDSDCNATCLDDLPANYYGTWVNAGTSYEINPGGGNSSSNDDPNKGLCGMKFDTPLTNYNTLRVYLSVDGIQNPGLVTFYIKASGNIISASIPGPASCAGDCDGLKFYKTVSEDTVVAGETVVYKFEFEKIWNNDLTNVTFTDVLQDGLLWVSEPSNITNGIVLGSTSITGSATAQFNIASLPLGISSFEITAQMPNPYTGNDPYLNQAILSNMTPLLGNPMLSDYPETPTLDDPTPHVILADTDCIGNYNIPELGTDFSGDNRSVTVTLNRPLLNVVLEFHDGNHEMFHASTSRSLTFSGTGENANKCVVAAWVRTQCNASGDGPEYGEYFANPGWQGFCAYIQTANGGDPATHTSTVLTNGGPHVIVIPIRPPIRGDDDEDDQGEDDQGDNGGNDGPYIPGHRQMNANSDVIEATLTCYPNPVKRNQFLQIDGLDEAGWAVNIYSASGKLIANQRMDQTNRIDLTGINISSGIVFLEFNNGLKSESARIVILD